MTLASLVPINEVPFPTLTLPPPANAHDIDVTWWYYEDVDCDGKVCEYRAKSKPQVVKHKASRHDIRSQWKQCPHCTFRKTLTEELNRHVENAHSGTDKFALKLEGKQRGEEGGNGGGAEV